MRVSMTIMFGKLRNVTMKMSSTVFIIHEPSHFRGTDSTLHLQIDRRGGNGFTDAISYTLIHVSLREDPLPMTTAETILIVDDNPTILNMLGAFLEQTSLHVCTATSGDAALEIAQDVPLDLILLDVMMPNIDGFEVCRRLKANATTQDIPVIFMTALSEPEDEVNGLHLGAVDYITKPFRKEIVLARINTHLALRKFQTLLKQQNAALDAYARTVAHDLKNPLSNIMSCVNYLLGNRSALEPEEQNDYLKLIKLSGARALMITQELLILAGVRRGEVSIQPLDMAAIISRVQDQLSPMIEAYQGMVIVPDTWPLAEGHTAWVEMVWINYLSNGLKYGGSPPCLELGATRQSDGMIRFWVLDRGQGLTREAQARLFTEFTRLEGTDAEGHGLGLSIARRIIERLGGAVGVESEVGHGSKFFFTLPAIE